MLTHSLIQYLTLPATPPPPVALAAGVRFIHKARLYEREIKDSLSPITRIVTVCVAGRLRANLPVVGPYCLRNRTALNRTPTAPAHPVRIWLRKPHRRLITALNPRITSGRIRTV